MHICTHKEGAQTLFQGTFFKYLGNKSLYLRIKIRHTSKKAPNPRRPGSGDGIRQASIPAAVRLSGPSIILIKGE